jgi:hypothetical protein
MTFGKSKCHTEAEAFEIGGFMAQHLPAGLTHADMLRLENDPARMEAFLAGLLPRPELPMAVIDTPSGKVEVVRHLGAFFGEGPAERRTIDFHRPDGGVTKVAALADRNERELPDDGSLQGHVAHHPV